MNTILGHNAITVVPGVILSAYLILGAALAARWVLVRTLPVAIGGVYLAASVGLGLAVGAWRWLTGSLDLEEEELGRAITRAQKSEKPCDGQLEQWPDKRGPTIEVDLDDDLETIKREIENALS